jgi:hypothetical protein
MHNLLISTPSLHDDHDGGDATKATSLLNNNNNNYNNNNNTTTTLLLPPMTSHLSLPPLLFPITQQQHQVVSLPSITQQLLLLSDAERDTVHTLANGFTTAAINEQQKAVAANTNMAKKPKKTQTKKQGQNHQNHQNHHHHLAPTASAPLITARPATARAFANTEPTGKIASNARAHPFANTARGVRSAVNAGALPFASTIASSIPASRAPAPLANTVA